MNGLETGNIKITKHNFIVGNAVTINEKKDTILNYKSCQRKLKFERDNIDQGQLHAEPREGAVAVKGVNQDTPEDTERGLTHLN